MADAKISALTGATTPLAGTEVIPVVQGGQTRKVSVADLTVGRAISATQLTLTTGNLIVASGKGIDFSATSGTGTSEVLSDYEEGTWTPTQGSGLIVVGAFSSQGVYTKIGRLVSIQGRVQGATSISCGASGVITGSLPFAESSATPGIASNTLASSASITLLFGAVIYSVNAIANGGGVIYFDLTYTV